MGAAVPRGGKVLSQFTRALLGGCVAAYGLTGAAVSGQTVKPKAEAVADSSDVSGLKEIIVTAQKRSENLQDVPIAVSSVSGENLAASGIKEATSLRVAVPTLYSANSNGFYTSTVRGIGS